MPMPPSRIGALVICRKQVRPGLRSWAVAVVGTFGGRNIRALLRKYPAATITALDYSEIAVEKAKSVNREGLQAGRCQILQGDVSCLPFGDGAFDLATGWCV